MREGINSLKFFLAYYITTDIKLPPNAFFNRCFVSEFHNFNIAISRKIKLNNCLAAIFIDLNIIAKIYDW
mgnify:CR=1 FL=1